MIHYHVKWPGKAGHLDTFGWSQGVHNTEVLTMCQTTVMVQMQLCGWDIGLAIARSQVQCPVVSVAVTVVSSLLQSTQLYKWVHLSHQYCKDLGDLSRRSSAGIWRDLSREVTVKKVQAFRVAA